MIEPQGPLPPEIYWRRRVVAGGVLVAVVALVIGLIVWAQSGGGDDATKNAAATDSSSSTAPSTATTNESVDPSQAPSGGGVGGGGGAADESSAAPSESAQAPASTTVATSVDANGVALCSDSSIAVVLYTDKPTYTVGSQPKFTIVTTNAGLAACTRDVGKAAQNVIVRTLDGTRTLWSARDCSPINTVNNQVLQPQQQVKDDITWSGTTSSAGCATPRTQVPAGSYQAIAKMGEKESTPVTFNIVAPAEQ